MVLFLHMFILNQFNSQVQDKPTQLDSSLPFEFCYTVSPKGSINPPNISLIAKGGSVFPVNDPIITITDTASNPPVVKEDGGSSHRDFGCGCWDCGLRLL
jgi:hypothetical protein